MKIGVLGGGQLGRMLALAGHPLGLSSAFLDPSPDAPMAPVADEIRAPYEDPAALDRLSRHRPGTREPSKPAAEDRFPRTWSTGQVERILAEQFEQKFEFGVQVNDLGLP